MKRSTVCYENQNFMQLMINYLQFNDCCYQLTNVLKIYFFDKINALCPITKPVSLSKRYLFVVVFLVDI